MVENETDGKRAIQYLKQRDGGRATFLPLTTIQPNRLRERDIDRCPGFVGVASDLVEYDQRYANIVARLLGTVVIAEDFDRALAMAKRYHYKLKIVTLDGQVLNPGGSMTGGSHSRAAGILSVPASWNGSMHNAKTWLTGRRTPRPAGDRRPRPTPGGD